MRKILIFILFLILALKNYSFSEEKNKVFDLTSSKRNFHIKFIFLEPRIITATNKAILEIYDINKNPVQSAKVEILLWMGEHGHYSSATPVIKEIKPGIYDVSKLDFEMKGRWEMIINIKKDNTKDKVSFEFLVE